MSGRIAIRDALDKHAHQAIERHRMIRRANVTKLKPLTVDVHGSGIPLTLDDDFDMSQWMVLYQQSVGLKLGDLVLMHQEQHDWLLIDVVSDAVMSGALAGRTAQTFAITPGYTADRAMNPQATSLGEVATVLATLIDDLKKAGVIHR